MAKQTGKHAGGRPSLGERVFVGIRIPPALLSSIDCAREGSGMSRSAFLSVLIYRALRRKA